MTTLHQLINTAPFIGLGIAGNQAEHLVQAGEADDFKDVIAKENAPKGLFPWYLPQGESFLSVNPLSADVLKLSGNDRLQPEPEMCIVVNFDYLKGGSLISSLKVLGVGAFNDCSRRVSAPKISLKKNWGEASQGMSTPILRVNDFSQERGEVDHFRLICFLERDGELLQYGVDTAVSDYCYLNATLIEWVVNQMNGQQNQGPLESISELVSAHKPRYAVIGIGATCYTDFGNSEQRFLREGDLVSVVLYDQRSEKKSSVVEALKVGARSRETMLILSQKVVA